MDFWSPVRPRALATAAAVCGLLIATGAQAQPAATVLEDLPPGRVGLAYAPISVVRGGTPPYRAVSDHPPPAGLAISPSGEIAGTPRAPGDYRFVLEITDAALPPQTVRSAFHLRILAARRQTSP